LGVDLEAGRLATLSEEFAALFEKILLLEVEDVVSDCERGRSGPNAAFQILGMMRQLQLLGFLDEDVAARALSRMDNCFRFELTMTSATREYHDSHLDFIDMRTRVRAVVALGLTDGSRATNQLSVPLEVTGSDFATSVDCATHTVTPTRQFTLTGLEMGIYLADEPVDPYFIVASFEPGRLKFEISSCEARTDEYDPYRTALDLFHTPTAYRVTEWQRVSGATWAYERWFGPRAGELPTFAGDDRAEEETRFFLRHAPASA
jgi:hypothetical protein